jgi:hypothetical protein
MTPALWINDDNKIGRDYFAPARNQYYIDALKRRWIRKTLEAIGIAATFIVLAVVSIAAVFAFTAAFIT